MSISFTFAGPLANWSIEIATLGLFLGIWTLTYKRLVPAAEPSLDEEKPYSQNISDDEGSTESESI
jgi:hypothetical protein